MRIPRTIALAALLGLLSCSPSPASDPKPDPRLAVAMAALTRAAPELGEGPTAALRARIEAEPRAFLDLLDAVLAERALDPFRFARVDKVAPPLEPGYAPADLVVLDGKGLVVSKPGHELRKGAYEALAAMAKAAAAEGVTLQVSSAYRSYAYQKTVFARNVAESGEVEARRVSAEPGRSQHQLGTAIDFGSITDAFAQTRAYAWLSANAARFGFTLSYPEGQEAVTGYRTESWHWRWLGAAAARLQSGWFGGIQEYLIVYLSVL